MSKQPCEDPEEWCSTESTHVTPIGLFLCDHHAELHNTIITNMTGIKPENKYKYLARPHE